MKPELGPHGPPGSATLLAGCCLAVWLFGWLRLAGFQLKFAAEISMQIWDWDGGLLPAGNYYKRNLPFKRQHFVASTLATRGPQIRYPRGGGGG
eukprot:COSAG01_NODE_3176_length_6464_cov_54.777219_6_plen_94_part_00